MERARYASPERARGVPLEAKSDVYSLALMLIEVVSGQVPFSGDSTVATLANRIDRLMPVTADLGRSLQCSNERGGHSPTPVTPRRSSAARWCRRPRSFRAPRRCRSSAAACSATATATRPAHSGSAPSVRHHCAAVAAGPRHVGARTDRPRRGRVGANACGRILGRLRPGLGDTGHGPARGRRLRAADRADAGHAVADSDHDVARRLGAAQRG
jgi:hypothetical protein